MRKTLVIVFFVMLNLVQHPVLAQEYNPFPKTSGYWKEQFGSVLCLDQWMTTDICQTYQFQLEGDTLVNSTNYKKILYSGRHDTEGTYFDEGYVGGLRDDTINKKIYFLEKDSTDEVILYDFNLNVGDTFNQPSFYQFPNGYETGGIITIGTIDSILLNNHYAKRFQLLGAGFGGEALIEGIGTTMGLFTHVYGYFEEHNDLLCFKNNGNTEYYDQDAWPNDVCDFITDIVNINARAFTLYPNPATTTISIQSMVNSPWSVVNIYNAQGQLVSHPLSRGECASLSAGKGCVLDISQLAPGLYYLHLQSAEGVGVKKFEVIK